MADRADDDIKPDPKLEPSTATIPLRRTPFPMSS
jgi:hypothetical protein